MSKRIVILGLVVALLLAGCTSPPSEESEEEEEEEQEEEQPTPPAPVSFDVRTTGIAAVLVQPIGFDPATLTAPSGAAVTITFYNEDTIAPHGWQLEGVDGARVDPVEGGESGDVTFTAPAPGDYVFFCPVGDHRSRGQEGTFTVTA